MKSTKICNKCKIKKPLTEFYKRKYGVRHICKICFLENQKQRRLKNPQYIKQWIIKNFKHYKHQRRQYRIIHKPERNKKEKLRRRNDPNFKIIGYIRNHQNAAIKGIYKVEHAITLLMCSVEEFKQHIEKQWLPGMNWSNHGNGIGKWNIDHIIPIAFFKDYINDPVEQYMCFRYNNQQPLWWEDNQRKRDKLIQNPNQESILYLEQTH